MITSRLTLVAVAFSLLSAASLAFAAGLRTDVASVNDVNAAPALKALKVVQLERVVISAKREAAAQR